MVWSADQKNAGFSEAATWLPVPENHRELAVDRQEVNPQSLLQHYRRFLDFRRRHRPLVKGTIELEQAADTLFSFRRRHGNETIYCAFNLSDEPRAIDLSGETVTLLPDSGFAGSLEGRSITIPAHDAFFGLVE